jgi:hypothetical protein
MPIFFDRFNLRHVTQIITWKNFYRWSANLKKIGDVYFPLIGNNPLGRPVKICLFWNMQSTPA